MKLKALAFAWVIGCANDAAAPARLATSISVGPATEGAAATNRTERDPRVERAVHEMSHVRELSILREVGSAVVSRAELMRALEAHVAREVPHDAIEREASFLKTLGVLGRDDDYERTALALIRRAAGGVYLPERNAMLLPDDLDNHELATSLAHEAVHALQDQHFVLEAFEQYLPGASDAMLARSCLAEGDATNAADEDPADTNGSYLERELAAPYVAGTAFVRALRARGGWAEVDRAWTRGALTTEQVLHPEKWEKDERAIDVPPPSFATLGAGFVRAWVDTRGELGLRLVLEAGIPRSRAAEAASGWGGDSAVLVSNGSRTALAWRVRYDDAASARRGFDAIREAFARKSACSSERAAPTAAVQSERDVLLLVGPPGSSCALLEAWSKEVFAR